MNRFNEKHERIQIDQNDPNKHSETIRFLRQAFNIKPEEKGDVLNKSSAAIMTHTDASPQITKSASQDFFITRPSPPKRERETDKTKDHSPDKHSQETIPERPERKKNLQITSTLLALDKPGGATDEFSPSVSNLFKANNFFKGLRSLLQKSVTSNVASPNNRLSSSNITERPSYKRKSECGDRLLTDPNDLYEKFDLKRMSTSQEVQKSSVIQRAMEKPQSQQNGAETFHRFQYIKQEKEQPPNKREFIIRHNTESLSEEQLAKNEEKTLEKLENMKKSNTFECGHGLKRFEFGSNRLFEQRTEERKRVLQTKIAQRLSGFKSPQKVPSHRLSGSEHEVVGFLRFAVTPTKKRLYQELESDLRVAIREKPKETKPRARSQEEPTKVIPLHTEPNAEKPELTISTADPTPVKRNTTVTSWKIFCSRESVKELAAKLAITNARMSTSSRNLFNSTQTSTYKDPVPDAEPENWNVIHQQVLAPLANKDGVSRSLNMKRQLRKALDSKRKISAWKSDFGANLSTSNTTGSFLIENSAERFDIKSSKISQTDAA